VELIALDAVNLDSGSTLAALSGSVGDVTILAGGLLSAAARAFVRASTNDKYRSGVISVPASGATVITSANVASYHNQSITGDVVLGNLGAASLSSLNLTVSGSLWITDAVPANLSLTLNVAGNPGGRHHRQRRCRDQPRVGQVHRHRGGQCGPAHCPSQHRRRVARRDG
jgi:hypothetical protein